jgi:hypothetical protein
MQKWEFISQWWTEQDTSPGNIMKDKGWDQLGEEGWELVSVINEPNPYVEKEALNPVWSICTGYFKRPLDESLAGKQFDNFGRAR